jgi:Flp pilus assembly protein TadD
MAFVMLSEGHDRPLVRLLHANVAIQQGDRDRALKYLQALEATTAVDARLFSLMGHTYLTLNMLEDAERHFRRAVEEHPRSAPAWTGLATALLRQQRYRDAADAALEAVGYDYANSHAHYLLGVALCGGRFFRRAMTAFETCLRLEPRTVRAHRWLDRIHTHVTGDHERATFHRRQASDLTPPPRPDEVTHA